MKRLGLLAVAIVVASKLVTVGAQVSEQPYSGQGDYQIYCASCHGADARGDGVIAKSQKKRPSDLTQLSNRNSGIFPHEKVVKFVDGREPGRAHSGSDMPAWGEVFAKSDSIGAERAAARIDVLVKYLETLQAK